MFTSNPGDGSARTGDGVANVVITGGAGFLGSRLARELLAAGSLDVAGSGGAAAVPGHAHRPVARSRATWPPTGGSPRSAATSANCWIPPARRVAGARRGRCHLPPRRRGQRGVRGRLRPRHAGEPARHRGAARRLPRAGDAARSWCSRAPLAVFGGSDPEHPLPPVVDDHTLPNPQSSYGTQKFIGRAAAGRLHPQGLPARPGRSA